MALPRLHTVPCLHSNRLTNHDGPVSFGVPYRSLPEMADAGQDESVHILFVGDSGARFR